MKLGQILATRPDLFGPEWINEFEKLQSQAPQLKFEELRPQIEEDLGAPLEEILAGRGHIRSRLGGLWMTQTEEVGGNGLADGDICARDQGCARNVHPKRRRDVSGRL